MTVLAAITASEIVVDKFIGGKINPNRISYPIRKDVNEKDPKRQDLNILLEYVILVKGGHLSKSILLLRITL